MTGDVTLHPTASIMVMTTEILRSMLYRGSQLIHEMKWLIFDEIHYMRDRERGVVWEESIVLVPSTVRFVFLSATIPNAREFAEWIASIKQQPCHVLYTDYRPTPLQHYMFPAGGEGVYLVMDEKKRFREENFHRAVATLHKTVEEQALQSKQVSPVPRQLSLLSGPFLHAEREDDVGVCLRLPSPTHERRGGKDFSLALSACLLVALFN